MKIKLYQIAPEKDDKKLMFMSYKFTVLHGGINAGNYELVFDGDLPAQTAEDVFRIFNLEHPSGYRGRSMSVSDIIWIEGLGYWFCDSVGFRRIQFSGENAAGGSLMDELYQNLVRLNPKEQVPFRCIGCGACCKHVHMQVPVETLDAFRIVKHLQQQGEDIECMDDFWERYTEPALLNECGFFVYFLKTQGPEEACIFLQGNRCRIHTVNPRACRIYPLVVDPKENGRYEYLVSYERKQHFKGPKVHVKTWMKKRVGEEDRAFLNADFGSAKELARLLRQIPDERKKRALMCFHWAKYGNFDTGKPFLPQYERNLKVLREYLKELTE